MWKRESIAGNKKEEAERLNAKAMLAQRYYSGFCQTQGPKEKKTNLGNEVVSKTAVVAGLVSDANDSGVINLSSKVAGNVKAMGAAGSTLSTGVAAIETINAVQNGYTTGAIQGGSDTIAGAVGFIPIPGARVFSGAYAVGRFLDDLSGASKFYGDLLSP